MKLNSLAFALVLSLFSMYAFTWNASPNYEKLMDPETKAEFVRTTDSEELKTNIHQFLFSVLDNVDRVDVHVGEETGYYYAAYGQKDGQAFLQKVLVTDDLALTQSFPTLQEMGIKSQSAFVHCYWKIKRLWISCQHDQTRLPICGYSITGEPCTIVQKPHDGVPIE